MITMQTDTGRDEHQWVQEGSLRASERVQDNIPLKMISRDTGPRKAGYRQKRADGRHGLFNGQ